MEIDYRIFYPHLYTANKNEQNNVEKETKKMFVNLCKLFDL